MENNVILIIKGMLNDYLGINSQSSTMSIKAGVSIERIVEGLGIPLEMVGIVRVNGTMVKLDYCIKNGDEIDIFPLVIGG